MNAAIELHDSQLGAVLNEEGGIAVRLSPAYVHRSVGRPGWDDGVGGWQDCALIVEGGHLQGEVGVLPTDVMGGDLRIGETDHPNMIALPWDAGGGAIALTLHLAPDHRRVIVTGTNLRVREEGGFAFVEEFRTQG